MTDINYTTIVKPLTQEEGGGYLVEFPDLPGCMADGATVEEAIQHGQDALISWIETAKEFNDEIPQATREKSYSGQWRLRVPKSLHAALANRASHEGVSLNTLVTVLLAQGVGDQFRSSSLKKNKIY